MYKTKRSVWKSTAWMLATSAFLVVACEKGVDLDGPVEHDADATESAATASIPYDDAAVIVDLAYDGSYSGKVADITGCASITVDTLTASIHRVVIDFGSGCTDANGNIRSGKIQADYSIPRIAGGATTDIRFFNYSLNQVEVDGYFHQTFLGLNTSNQPEWSIDIDGYAVYAPGDTLFYISDRTRTWTNGFAPFDPNNIEFSITGSASGERTGYAGWLATTSSPLIYRYGCPWIVGGSYEISVTGMYLYEVNFGSGTCDNDATVSGRGGSVNIEL